MVYIYVVHVKKKWIKGNPNQTDRLIQKSIQQIKKYWFDLFFNFLSVFNFYCGSAWILDTLKTDVKVSEYKKYISELRFIYTCRHKIYKWSSYVVIVGHAKKKTSKNRRSWCITLIK